MNAPLSITRPLLEHYARAKGLKPPTFESTQRGIDWLWHCAEPSIGRNEIAFRLGLCAAAENLSNSRLRSDPILKKALDIERDKILLAAGIDPATWEATR